MLNNKNFNVSAGILAVTLSACYVPSAVAASNSGGAGQADKKRLEEVVVTVRRRVEMEQDVPISLNVMDNDDLRKKNVAELTDLGRKIPAVSISSVNASTNVPIITVRGQRPTDTTLSLDQAVPIYFNEVVMTPSNGTNLAMYDLQSVQVLKGPQGTLFGRNSTGGAFLITPTRPGAEFGGYADFEAGNYELLRFKGAVDLPVNDSVQFRVAGQKTKRDGYQKNVADNALKGKRFWNEDSQGARISMNLDLGSLTNLVVASYDENEMFARQFVPAAFIPGPPLSLSGGLINNFYNGSGQIDAAIERAKHRKSVHDIETDMLSKEKVENTFFSNTTEFELNDSLTLKNIFGYRKVDFKSSSDADGTALPILGSITSATDYVTAHPDPSNVTESEQFSNEFQFVGDAFDSDLEWIAGLYWYQMNASTTATQQISGASPALPYQFVISNPTGDVSNTAYGAFSEGTYTFNPRWSMTLGLRQSWDNREVTVKNRSTSLPVPAGTAPTCTVKDKSGNTLPDERCARTESKGFGSPTGRVSLNFTPVDGMLLYGGVSTGYRAGGINLRGEDNKSLRPFEEEKVTTYEIGNKTDWGPVSNIPMQTNVAVYYQDYKNIQKTQTVSSASGYGTTTVNAGAATIQGVEFDVTWAATEDLLLYMAYAYTDAKYDNWDYEALTSPTTTVTVDASSNDFEWLPKNTLTASATYTLPVAAELGDISFTASVYWQDEMTTYATPNNWLDLGLDPANLKAAQSTLKADAYDIWNLRFDWRGVMGQNIDVAAYVDNLTDKEYMVGGYNETAPMSLGFAEFLYGQPRTFGASIRYNF